MRIPGNINQYKNKGLNRMEVGCKRFGRADGVTWKWKPKEKSGLKFCHHLQT